MFTGQLLTLVYQLAVQRSVLHKQVRFFLAVQREYDKPSCTAQAQGRENVMNTRPPRFRYLSEADFLALKERVQHLLNRAYFNLHGTKMPTTPADWHDNIFNAALELAMDPTLRGQSDKQVMHLFEDIITISQELHAKAQECMSKASNPIYLRAVVMDAHLRAQQAEKLAMPERPAGQIVGGADHTGTLPQVPEEVDDLTDFAFAS